MHKILHRHSSTCNMYFWEWNSICMFQFLLLAMSLVDMLLFSGVSNWTDCTRLKNWSRPGKGCMPLSRFLLKGLPPPPPPPTFYFILNSVQAAFKGCLPISCKVHHIMDLAHHEEHVTLVQLGPVIQFSPLVDELSSSLFTYIYIYIDL